MSTARLQELCTENNGSLPAYAWPGGYAVHYLDKHGSVLCAQCATKDLLDPDTDDKPVADDVYWEGPTVQCKGCNVDMESAYGDPEDEDEYR